MSVSMRLTLAIIGVTFIALVSFFMIAVHFYSIHSRSSIAIQGQTLAQMTAEFAVSELILRYQEDAKESLKRLFLLSFIEEAQIYDHEGKLFAFNTRNKNQNDFPVSISPETNAEVIVGKNRLEIYQPMVFRQVRRGTLRLVASTVSFEMLLSSHLQYLGLALILVSILAFFLAMAVQRSISRPILKVITNVQAMASGYLHTRIRIDDPGSEIETLAQNINQLANNLEARITENERAVVRYKALIRASNTGAWEYNSNTRNLWCSSEYFSMLGRDIKDLDPQTAGNLEDSWLKLLHPDDKERAKKFFLDYLKDPRGIYQQTFRMQHKDGKWIWIWSRGKTLTDAKGNFTETTIGTHIDISERIQLEERLRQSEKMEAIGQLAGGIAHDFNNQLGGVSGFIELLKWKLTEPDHIKLAEKIRQAVLRTSSLTKQLLAFARRGKFVNQPINIHTLIQEVIELLQHSIDKRISLTTNLSADFFTVSGDATQLQNALLNLGINARDALPGGGKIEFVTTNICLDEIDNCYHLPAGDYICICVSDDGAGISEEVRSRVFEPFFTTKERGKGTGLGLAATYGAVKNHNGNISFYSEVGHGTTFKILLPIISNEKKEENIVTSKSLKNIFKGSNQTVLLVDDEELIREATISLLEDLGFQVKTCIDGQEALDLYRDCHEDIDLVILDMVMPRMSGKETFKELRRVNPSVPIIIISGFSQNESINEMVETEKCVFVQKPFQANEIVDAIKQVQSSN